MTSISRLFTAAALVPVILQAQPADEAQAELPMLEFPPLQVQSLAFANEAPAGTFAQPVSVLRFTPLVDVQSRGPAESQADVSVRAGIFESTGFVLGALPLFDPQTGHYFAELPLDPAMLLAPQLETGLVNSLRGFNSTVASVHYGLSPLATSGEAELGVGTDDLNFQRLRQGYWFGEEAKGWGLELSGARSEGDGSLNGGDHEFQRLSGRLQLRSELGQTDAFVGYQDEFYGWPGMYTGNAARLEIDQYEVLLLGLNHQARYGTGSQLELAVGYRKLLDDYDFDRTTAPDAVGLAFEHETEAYLSGLSGRHVFGQGWALRYGAQAVRDELVSSTNLTFGPYSERRYYELSLAPQYTWLFAGGRELTVTAGGSYDDDNRGPGAWSPLAELATRLPSSRGVWDLTLTYAGSSQVPGYTALKSSPTSGLFRGNAELERQTTRHYESALAYAEGHWGIRTALFFREDDDLTDWTYVAATGARQANEVDTETWGWELLVQTEWEAFRAAVGYTYYEKDAAYADVSAGTAGSYYALNFPEHRATLSLSYRWRDQLELRGDLEARRQAPNPLRTSSREAFVTALALSWEVPSVEGLVLSLVGDNLTKSNYQEYPGTPAAGREISGRLAYAW